MFYLLSKVKEKFDPAREGMHKLVLSFGFGGCLFNGTMHNAKFI
jgi:hypothetical protein